MISEDVPINEILEDGEVALYVGDESIFSPDSLSITNFLHSVGWELCFFHITTKKENNQPIEIYRDIYRDDFGNYILVEYELGRFEEIYEDKLFSMLGLKINPYGIVVGRDGSDETVDLRDFIKLYQYNHFKDVVERVKNYIIKKSLEDRKFYI